jgi:ATP-dependent Clp protease protease subunit
MAIQMAEMQHARNRIEEILAEHTGQTRERIAADIERDYIVRGADAVAYGLVDHVITDRRLRAVSGGEVAVAHPGEVAAGC